MAKPLIPAEITLHIANRTPLETTCKINIRIKDIVAYHDKEDGGSKVYTDNHIFNVKESRSDILNIIEKAAIKLDVPFVCTSKEDLI
ncbi:hypothetical protein QTV49_000575 [Vibrio vulnificus]|nr:hypothetical protein [Vibrio vulnificus]